MATLNSVRNLLSNLGFTHEDISDYQILDLNFNKVASYLSKKSNFSSIEDIEDMDEWLCDLRIACHEN